MIHSAKNKFTSGILSALLFSFSALSSEATPTLSLHPLIAEHMVVQRNSAVPIWGMATAGATIRVALGTANETARADSNGHWSVSLPALPEGQPPLELTVTDGTTLCRVADILVGDVWLCSGQSNMQWSVGKSANAPAEIAAADHPRVRFLTMPRTLAFAPRQRPETAAWNVCSPTTVGDFSAVGYYFARELKKHVDVPIGLINASWGGTPIQGWMSRESLQTLGLYPAQLALLDRASAEPDMIERIYADELAAWWPTVDRGVAEATAPWFAPQAPGEWSPMVVPGAWEDHGKPDFDGIIWYRCNFDCPPEFLSGSDVELDLGRVDDWDTTWINGTPIGASFSWTNHRRYVVPANILKGTNNVIAIRVLDYGMKGGLLDQPALTTKNSRFPLPATWLHRVSAAKDAVGDQPLRLDRNIRHPTQLFNGLIAPLGALPLRGVLWYQGESNAGEPALYQQLLPAMIADWRQRFGSPELPFGIVQLANRQAVQKTPIQNGWAAFRDAQRAVASSVPHCGLAVTIDIGEADSIHPMNKQDVGKRLANWAAAEVYKLPGIRAHGPRYLSHEIKGDALHVRFDANDLRSRNNSPVTGFAIAGEDRKWQFAEGTITGDLVVLTANGVKNPVAVRYAWANNPVATVTDADGLPVEPFRSDTW